MHSFLKYEEEISCRLVSMATLLLSQEQSLFSLSDTFIKNDGSLVTVFDFAIQAAFCEKILSIFPEDEFLGEESGAILKTHPQLIDKVLFFANKINPSVSSDNLFELLSSHYHKKASRVWISDPIDGTSGFAAGRESAVTLSLIENDEPILGILGCPKYIYQNIEQSVVLLAKKNEGSFAFTHYPDKKEQLHINKISANKPLVYTEARFSSTYHNHFLSFTSMLYASKNQPVNSWRKDSQTKYGYVATGNADVLFRLPFYKSEEQVWDHVAGLLLIKEAGGVFSDMFGSPISFSNKYTLKGTHGIIAGEASLCKTLTSYMQQHFL
ncbi:3'(2'),5'-bisphosphate nucleotidase [Candidatus Clavichlamydia salmonicola]|uniref:inositol monophosphatase family protein n=1 Tax=Candidatus Clavichlamydia salmonicola TaxID=469812 RepID=UPI0018919D48|nr:inositol monophosphatase family protein [Candidatus Clavichlamydia salmonicola]MBF5050483.1 3'(2'),5'-bisphosphate nucleotidase [Candidatus Clavichlamydia salmonicola]